MRRALALTLALATSSCGTAPVHEDAAIDVDAGVQLTIGTGFTAYEALPDEAPTLEIVHGPQGGYHVYLSMRVTGVEPATLLWHVVREDDARVLAHLDLIARRGTFVEVDGALQRVGDLVVLNVISPADVLTRDIRVEASATSASGARATATRVVRILDAEP